MLLNATDLEPSGHVLHVCMLLGNYGVATLVSHMLSSVV